MNDEYRKYSPRFHISRLTDGGNLTGYWSMFGDAREEPSILRHFEQWFEWCLAKHEGRISFGVEVWKGVV